MPQNIAFLVRRARFLLDMTQSQFAEMFEVDTETVSRWERGKIVPSTEAYAHIRDINIGVLDEATKASPVLKYLAYQSALTHPVAVSEGFRQAIRQLGVSDRDLGYHVKQVLPADPHELGCLHALELIQRDPKWRKHKPAYVELHCMSAHFGWLQALVVPILYHSLVLVEFARSSQVGFWVHFVFPEDLTPLK
jgi:transcriptional regulator with XRE-family HTH domain